MNVYPDTSFICPLYRRQHTPPQAVVYQKTQTEAEGMVVPL